MTLTDYAIIAIAGFPGWLTLICMGADYIQTRDDSSHEDAHGDCFPFVNQDFHSSTASLKGQDRG